MLGAPVKGVKTMNKKLVWTTSALLVSAMATGLFGSVSAQNPTPYPCMPGGGGTWHCFSTYDLGLIGDALTVRESCDELGGVPCTIVFADGNLDIGGIIYDGCYSANHAGNGLPPGDLLGVGKGPNRDWPHCNMPGGAAWSSELVYIQDAVFGLDVGGFYCIDLNNDGDCGDPADGEFGTGFCGHATFPHVPNYAQAMAYFVDGPIFQPTDCPATANPIGGTTGTISIWLSPTTAPQCSDGLDNDADGYRDWGYGSGWPDRSPFAAYPGNLETFGLGTGGCDHIADNTE